MQHNIPQKGGSMRIKAANPRKTEFRNWYSIYTRSKFERSMLFALEQKKFEAYLPLVKEKRIWSDRVKTLEVPLLPGYIFVKCSQKELTELYPIRGFVKLISEEGKPAIIRDEEIELLKKIVSHGSNIETSNSFKAGEKVKIVRGPFCGMEGKIAYIKGKNRVIFQLESVKQCISIEVHQGMLAQR
ncbi:MAG: UpxY family transcription antiterminator [Bacteroidia bacterium]|nr:UpxY family transcription antiterminator [Bacteroidia bacterium]